MRAYRFVPRDQALADSKPAPGWRMSWTACRRIRCPTPSSSEPRDAAPQALEALRAEISRVARVAHVQLDSAWAQRLEAGLKVGRLAAAILAALFAFALVAVTFNTIRLQMLTQREEIEVAS